MSEIPQSLSGSPGVFTFWDKIRLLFGTKITWEWCVVGCVVGKHTWHVYLEKCYNGTPIVSGGFLVVYKCESKEAADSLCEDFDEVAEKLNGERGYA